MSGTGVAGTTETIGSYGSIPGFPKSSKMDKSEATALKGLKGAQGSSTAQAGSLKEHRMSVVNPSPTTGKAIQVAKGKIPPIVMSIDRPVMFNPAIKQQYVDETLIFINRFREGMKPAEKSGSGNNPLIPLDSELTKQYEILERSLNLLEQTLKNPHYQNDPKTARVIMVAIHSARAVQEKLQELPVLPEQERRKEAAVKLLGGICKKLSAMVLQGTPTP